MGRANGGDGIMAEKNKKNTGDKQYSNPPREVRGRVSPGKPYYSSEALKKGFEETLPAALISEETKKRSPLGKYSPRAAVLDVTTKVMDLPRDKEGKRGSRLARKTAKKYSGKLVK